MKASIACTTQCCAKSAPGAALMLGACLAMTVCLLWHAPLAAQSSAASFSPRVHRLLSQMTQEEKLSLTDGSHDPSDGGQAGYTPGVPRLGIPALRWTDGPGGIDNRYDATNLPQVLSVASTFDRSISAEFGDVIGREARATRMDVFLGPMVNIARVPNWGRNLTSFGEDPALTAAMAVPMIQSIEKWGVLTTTKHFIANNQSLNVNGPHHEPGADFIVDPRTLHEIYLPGFEAAVKAGGGGVMAAYNKINGLQSSSNGPLLNGVLHHDFGWTGLTVSDWGAVHEPEAMNAGLDVEMPGVGMSPAIPGHYGKELDTAIKSGRITQSALDLAVMRVLGQMERMGMLDGTRVSAPDQVEVDRDAAIARRIAEKGAVLLKNSGILPLTSRSLHKLAVIGPNGGQLAPSQGFGSAYGIEERRIAPLDALRKQAGEEAEIHYAVGIDLTGVPIPSNMLQTLKGEAGLERRSLDGTPATRDAALDFVGDRAFPEGRGYVWEGRLVPQESGEYLICTQSWGGSAELAMDDKVVGRSGVTPFGFGFPRKTASLLPTTDGLDNSQTTLKLEAGKTYLIRMKGQAAAESKLQIRLAWVTPSMQVRRIKEAAEVASSAETVVLFAWQRGGELASNDETLRLSHRQDDLIEAVAAANPRCIVVLNSAGPLIMPWIDKVGAILEMWYPGQEGGWATADILLGRTNPSGHLPITFPARVEDSPVFAPGHPERYYGTHLAGGPDNQVIYSEGIFVGYRYFDENKIEPLFPFGFGLSYTKFEMSNLSVSSTGQLVTVKFNVRNAGGVPGDEVAQVYLSRPKNPPVPMAPQTLAAFDRVSLQPGETKTMRLQIPPRAFSYWSAESGKWLMASGLRSILVGDSSRDIQLHADINSPVQ